MRKAYRFTKSKRLWAQALKIIPGGSQGTRQPEMKEWPIYFVRAKGCRMWDLDGNEYIDFLCSIGPILLGYAYKRVDDTVRAIMKTSFQSSMNHPIMVEAARLLTEMIPCADQVRFFKTGTESTQAAVRLARFVTRRMFIARHGYHGWADMFIGHWNNPGADKDASAKVLPFDGTADGLEKLMRDSGKEFAGVILCPADTRPFTTENYQGIIDVAHRYGALAIFDEIKSGFRMAPGGAQEVLKVKPDLTTVSKGIANGYPLSAVVGKKDYMSEMARAGIAGTFAVEGLSLAAAVATLREVREKNVPAHLDRVGRRLIDGLNEISERHGIGARAYPDPVPAMPRFIWKDAVVKDGGAPIVNDAHRYFVQQTYRYGLYVSSWHVGFVNFSHQNRDIDEALDIFDFCMKRTKSKFKL
ncbi:MAG: aminotransferase class III-fold pyridoxal phosphate-dependent enzyme [Planctomycetota bacterium]